MLVSSELISCPSFEFDCTAAYIVEARGSWCNVLLCSFLSTLYGTKFMILIYVYAVLLAENMCSVSAFFARSCSWEMTLKLEENCNDC
jgi:hypothetical protein